MPGSLAHLLVPLVLVSFEDRVEARARSFGDEGLRFDFVETAALQLSLTGRKTTASISYVPTVTLFSVGTEDFDLGFFQSLEGNITHTYRGGFVSLTQSGTFGRNNFRLTLAPTTLDDPAGPAAPTEPAGGTAARGPAFDQLVWFAASNTTLSLGQVLGPRLSSYQYASYSVHGGLDAQATELYPFMQQQSAGAGLGYRSTPRDTVLVGMDAQRTATAGFGEVYIFTLRPRWEHLFSRRTNGRISAGPSYAEDQRPGEPRTTRWLPVADAGLTTNWTDTSTRSSLSADAGIAPVVDWFTGQLDQRLYGTVSLTQTEDKLTRVIAASGVTSVDSDSEAALTMVALMGSLSYRLSRHWFADATINTSWQLFEAAETPALLWMGAVGLTYRPTPFRP